MEAVVFLTLQNACDTIFSTSTFTKDKEGWYSILNEDIRAQLIRQFPADVVVTRGDLSEVYYTCPLCGRSVAQGMEKCTACDQILNWSRVKEEEAEKGMKIARLEFEVPSDFTPGDCRRCPVSFIGKSGDSRVYECPLNARGTCRLKVYDH